MLKTSLAALALGAALTTAGGAVAQEKPKFVYLTQTGIDNSFWQSIKKGMDDACAQFEADCQLIFTTPNGDLQKHLQNLDTVVEQGVDGIVTVIVNDDLQNAFRALQGILAAERLRRARRTGLAPFVEGLLAETP